MSHVITIRTEEPRDHTTVESLITQAFAETAHSNGNEATLVKNLRKSHAFIPELSLVAEVNGIVAGYIMFTKIGIGQGHGIALAPLAVLPKYQRQGIGTALIAHGHAVARRMKFAVSVVLGSPDYYIRHGYVPASDFGIIAPAEGMDEFYMACHLTTSISVPQGMVTYDNAFGLG